MEGGRAVLASEKEEIVKLLRQGVINHQNYDGRTVLHMVRPRGRAHARTDDADSTHAPAAHTHQQHLR